MKRKFGRIPSPLDTRDFKLAPHLSLLSATPLIQNKRWNYVGPSLDQGETGHCGGFSMATWRRTAPVMSPDTNKQGHAYYYAAKIFDGEPKKENGTTLRSSPPNEERIWGRVLSGGFEEFEQFGNLRGDLVFG